MMPGMYAAISGLEAHQTMLDVTANNLANVDTIGYKAAAHDVRPTSCRRRVQAGTGANGYNGGTNPMQVGLGVQVGSIDNVMTAGSLQTTGNALDIAIQGDGFLRVGNGERRAPRRRLPTATQYTRAGNLTLNSIGFLTTQTGQYVLGYGATQQCRAPARIGQHRGRRQQPINVPPGSTERDHRTRTVASTTRRLPARR